MVSKRKSPAVIRITAGLSPVTVRRQAGAYQKMSYTVSTTRPLSRSTSNASL
jgi:hypothetical protein